MQKETVSARTRCVKKPSGGCVWCGAALPAVAPRAPGRKRKYCSQSCRQRAYESRKWGIGEIWEFLRGEYDRCYLCDEELDWANVQSICLDHVIATVYGGRTDVENLRPVHLRCNASKGSRLIDPDYLRQV